MARERGEHCFRKPPNREMHGRAMILRVDFLSMVRFCYTILDRWG